MVIDSSVFIEIFSDGPLRSKCERAMSGKPAFVPTLVLFEVYKKLKSKASEHEALSAIAALRRFDVVDLTAEVALGAADVSLDHNLAMADSFVLAHARELRVPLLTLDNDFAKISGVTVVR